MDFIKRQWVSLLFILFYIYCIFDLWPLLYNLEEIDISHFLLIMGSFVIIILSEIERVINSENRRINRQIQDLINQKKAKK